ncbi:GNAT family N-acetyltransferase [Neobacillus mesonae]|uniref:GNAT family N-acetyltransferase n=1 Tax=Neobacillus mesonae TaxID=1193713 RepID=UPI00083512E4|nr:GNAT family N-acetyltransferase [Neobacillus mesonae]
MLSKIITTTNEFYKLEKDWEKLQELDEDITYYSTFEYAKAWWDVYKNDKDKSLFVICVYEEAEIVGIGPFIIKKEKRMFLEWNTLGFLGKGDFLGVVLNRHNNNELTIVKEMFNCIDQNKHLWDRLNLTHIKNNSKLAAFLLKQNMYNANLKYLIECPQLKFKQFKNWDEYKQKFVTSSAKKYRNKLKREFDYSFNIIKGNEGNVLEKISELHKKTQEYLKAVEGRKDRRSLYEDQKFYGFLDKLYSNNKNVITFMIQDKDGKLIIYDTCYLYKGVLHSWNTAYDPNYFKYSVGKVINYEMMLYIFEHQISNTFDFGAGRYPWKFEWTDDFMLVYQLDLWNTDAKKGRRIKKLFEYSKRILNKQV